MENQIEIAILDLKNLLGKGQFLEAMDKYLTDDVVLQEANGTPKIGKERKKMNPDQNELADQDSTLLAPGSGRAARIRQMLDAGYTIDEVQSATGYSYTEIDLVMKLPKSRKPDRYKKPV